MKKFTLLASCVAFIPIAATMAQTERLPSQLPGTPTAGLQPVAGNEFLSDALPPSRARAGAGQAHKGEISFTYMERIPNSNATSHEGHQAHFMNPKTVTLSLDTDIASIDLPPDGKRMAVLTITARRHQGLVIALKDAKTDEEKTRAETALRENYQEHYAVETWWRQQRLAELEEQLVELKAQVQTRTEAEEKYVDAAMTIAKLHVDGVSITPPVPAAPGANAMTSLSSTREIGLLPSYARRPMPSYADPGPRPTLPGGPANMAPNFEDELPPSALPAPSTSTF